MSIEAALLDAMSHAGTPSCPATPVLIVQDGCAACSTAETSLRAEISSGAIRLLNIKTPEAQRFMAEAGLDLVPQLFVTDCHDKVVREVPLTTQFGQSMGGRLQDMEHKLVQNATALRDSDG